MRHKLVAYSRSVGSFIVKAYLNHLLWFTIGGFCGAFVGMSVAYSVFVVMLKQRGLM
jgi:hypothetical protein